MATLTSYPRGWKGAGKRLGMSVENYARERYAGRKWCYACSSFVSGSFFRHNSTKADGLRSECIACHQLQKYASRQIRRGINSQGLTTIIRIPQSAKRQS